ncbi:MAG: Lambda-carrageenase precursor [candidate division BRC1 bacterium ADurb.BinA364]|nr:MAG: Lambda-carrageenase precursor [candidate division BRC1 bacterium ADurb.BinA364]
MAETAVACADGSFVALSAQGKALWALRPNNAAKYAAAIVRRSRQDAPVIVCGGMDRIVRAVSAEGKELAVYDMGKAVNHLAAGDFDGDGNDEIAVLSVQASLCDILRFEGGHLERIRRIALEAPDGAGKKARFQAHSIDAGDLDGDGKAEILLGGYYGNSSRVAALAGDGRLLWITPDWRGKKGTGLDRQDMFSMTLARACPPREGTNLRAIAVTANAVRAFDARGESLGEAHAPLGFTDLRVDGTTLILGSSPNGDNTIYRIDLAGDWRKAVNALERQGLAREMGETLARLREQVLAFESEAPQGEPLEVRLNPMPHDKDPAAPASLAWFRETFPYPNLLPVAQCGNLSASIEDEWKLDSAGLPGDPPVANPRGRPREAIADWARKLEAMGEPTELHIDHGCVPKLTLESLELILKEAPTALRGFMSHEDEKLDLLPVYCRGFIGPLADLCARKDAILTMQEKNVWWAATPARKAVFEALFAGRRPEALVAGTDDANSRTPELNLLGRMGLRQAGLIRTFQTSIIRDMFSFSRMQEWEYPKHGSPFLRVLTAQTVLGAGRYYTRMDCLDGDRFTADVDEGAGLFFHMLGRGIVFPPRPDQMAGLSPVGFAMHEPPRKWLEDGMNGLGVDVWAEDSDLDNAVFPHNGCFWGMTPPPESSLPAALLNKKRQFGYFVPPTPYGPFVIVPALADLSKVPGVSEWWHTDGISVWREGGRKMTGAEAAQAVRESFESAASRLPFRALGDDVFCQTIRLDSGGWRIFLIDPGWLDPAERHVRLRVQTSERVELRDLLSGEPLAVEDGEARIAVPAGALRIVEAIAQ